MIGAAWTKCREKIWVKLDFLIGGFSLAYFGAEYWPLPNIVNNIPNFLALQFGEKFMKIWPKIAKLQSLH